MARDKEFAAKFLTEFQDRIMFGTDICAPQYTCRMDLLLIELRDEGKLSQEHSRKLPGKMPSNC